MRRRAVGWGVVAAGVVVVVWATAAAGDAELERADRLISGGPYAWSRNPMYVGWSLIHLGTGLAAGSAWIVATVPLAGVRMHLEVLTEERRLEGRFGDTYRRYRASVRRYF
ncbi:isoprenylcysteine carboxylmethyltransferase family protein [Kribbella sp. NPDC048915]|uniref:methyltransferase family protein n=1 Tax=Kribbella sp. NPDC048915 TaxID=3155148 RepID=UPI0033D5FA26